MRSPVGADQPESVAAVPDRTFQRASQAENAGSIPVARSRRQCWSGPISGRFEAFFEGCPSRDIARVVGAWLG